MFAESFKEASGQQMWISSKTIKEKFEFATRVFFATILQQAWQSQLIIFYLGCNGTGRQHKIFLPCYKKSNFQISWLHASSSIN